MTAFEKSLRMLDAEALRAGAEELLALLAETDGVRTMRAGPRSSGGQKRRGDAAARVSAPVAAGASPEMSGGEPQAASAAGVPVPDGASAEPARARRAYPKRDSGGPAAKDAARRDDEPLREEAFPETPAGKERGERKRQKSREKREVKKAQGGREDREAPAARKTRDAPQNRNDAEERKARTDREEQDLPLRVLPARGWETADREEARRLEQQLQSLSRRRRGSMQPSGEDGEGEARTAAFRGPERQYEGAAGARGTEMRRISDYFRRDSRRYDTGFTTY